MMSEIISIERASACLADLIHLLGPTDEIVLTENERPVARILLSGIGRPTLKPAASVVTQTDFVENGETMHFKDYMP